MQRGFKLRNYEIAKLQNPQRGYMLITLMLALALITIAMLAVLPDIGQQVRRDREEEMVHRGTAYMRAIQHFYKKFGRYPNTVEELQNTNNLHFIRKRYTDPLNFDRATGKEKDFKFLHQTDINLNVGPVLGQTPGLNTPAGQSGPQGQGGLQGQAGLAAVQGVLGAMQGGIQQTGGIQNLNGDSGNSSSGNTSSNSSSGLNGPTFGGGPILEVLERHADAGQAGAQRQQRNQIGRQRAHRNATELPPPQSWIAERGRTHCHAETIAFPDRAYHARRRLLHVMLNARFGSAAFKSASTVSPAIAVCPSPTSGRAPSGK